MVSAKLHHGANSVTLHWPNDLGVDGVQMRLCVAFQRPWRRVRAVIRCGGRELFEFEKPWLQLPRHCTVEADVSFEARPAEEIAELVWHVGSDGDESDGWTTASSITEAVDSLGF